MTICGMYHGGETRALLYLSISQLRDWPKQGRKDRTSNREPHAGHTPGPIQDSLRKF